MSPLDRVHLPSLAFALLYAVLVAVVLAVDEVRFVSLTGLSLVLGLAFVVAVSLPAVREHELYHLGSSVLITVLFALWWLVAEKPALFPAAIVVLGAVGVLVELYNYWQGTEYVHVEW